MAVPGQSFVRVRDVTDPQRQTGVGPFHDLALRFLIADLSATPFFLRGSGYREGTLFPWVVSDFSLMDAIECGIVKLPRIPVADNFAAADEPVYRNLWQHVGRELLRTRHALDLPAMLQTALYALYSNYETYYDEWDKHRVGVPPVFIVVCQNTAISRLVYEWIAG